MARAKKKTAKKRATKKVTRKAQPKKPTVKKAPKTPIMPLGNRVLVEVPPREEVTASGIIIPETGSDERPEQGVVVAVGEGAYDSGTLVKPSVAVGDTIVFSKYGFDEVTVKGKDYLIIKGENILAVLS